jgi:glycosyltransferase involved in cell wall biosynthesis
MFVTSSGNLLGGAENALLDVVASPGANAWNPIVIVPFEGELAVALRDAGVECVVMDLGVLRHRGEATSPVLLLRLLASIFAAFRLSQIIRARDVAIVHSNTSALIAGGLAAKLGAVPHVWHVREVLEGRMWQVLSRLILRLSDRVVCISGTVAANMRGAKWRDRIVIVPDGVDVGSFFPEEGKRIEGRVLMVGRINPIKGHELFLRAASLAAREVPQARFEILGGCLPVYEPLRRSLQRLAEQAGIMDRVTFGPHVDRAAVAEAIRRAEVVAVPSTGIEGGGLVVLEAMAAGTPVVATRRGGLAESIEDGVDGFLVSHTDPAELARALVRLLGDADLRARFVANGQRKVRERYALPIHVARLGELYHQLAGIPQDTTCA